MLRSTCLLLGAALLLRGPGPAPVPDPPTDEVDFVRDVQPLLEARCTRCHGSERQKGKLRLDRRSSAFRERDEVTLLVPGAPDLSELYRRVSLPEEDFDVMPPEEPFLTPDEVDLFRRWILEGADWPETAPGPAPEPDSKPGPAPLDLAPLTGEALARAEAARAALAERGALALPVAAGTSALDVNLSLLAEPATDADLARLVGLEPVLVWLHLGRSAVTDAGLASLTPFRELRRLQLQETAIGDAGLAHLVGLQRLEVLNLFGSRVTDAGLVHLERLPALQRVYLWRSAVTPEGADRLRAARPNLTVDTGWEPAPEEELGPATFAEVGPILSANCYACHGPDEAARKAGLRLDTFEGATREGAAALVPGDPAASELIRRVEHGDEEVRMPPAGMGPRLPPGEIDVLRRWIEGGAKYDEHWSFEPPRRPEPPPAPPGAGDDEAVGAVDAFVRARLAAAGLAPSPEADRATLARRVSLDLRGLPPTEEEVDAFVADEFPDAYARLVDRFLADPAYGERWASVWLDLARYADTRGYEKDDRRTMWPYRDWVIRALNEDVPYDRFSVLQLAGDLVEDADDESVLATAFHRNTMTNDEGGTDDEEFRSAAVVDRVNTTMQVWMGLTFACAQCHTHKFDPVSIEEYYGVYAVFDQTEDADRPDEAPLLATPDAEQAARLATLESRHAAAETELARASATAEQRFPAWLTSLRSDAAAPIADDREGLHVRAPGDASGLAEATWIGGEATSAPGVRSTAAAFDGERALELSRDAGDFERDQPFAYALWVKRAGGGPHVPLSRMDATRESRGWDLYLAGGRIVAHLIHAWPDDAIRVETDALVPDGTWTHVAVSWDGSGTAAGVGVFVNGRPVEARATHDTLSATIRTSAPLFLGRRHAGQGMRGLVDDARLYDRALDAAHARALVRSGARRLAERGDAEALALLETLATAEDEAHAAALAERDEAQRALAALEAEIPRVPVLRELAGDARRTTHVHVRGSFLDQGPEVRPTVPAAFHAGPAEPDRLAFARWLVDERNPLTARVHVNRIWAELFGGGLVLTGEDFGTQGERPTHPEVLDWLAVDFVASGWSQKALVRRIVTSATYRQASTARADGLEHDPENRLLWRGPRHRLSAEMIRDQALAVSGLLSRRMYGPPVFPPQPDGVWQVVYSGDSWEDAEGEDRWRRALYTFWRRTAPYPSMTAFDVPSRELCVSRRVRTNTPLQAFVTLNDPVFVEAAQALARRVASETEGDERTRAARAFRWCTARQPTNEELDALVALYRSERASYDSDSAAATLLAGADAAGTSAAELAAWTVVGNVLLNLDEVLVKG